MDKQPWLPSELRGYETARKVLGLLVSPKFKEENYQAQYEDKILELIKQGNENPQEVLNDLLPRGFEINKGEKPESTLARMYQESAWMRPDILFTSYLRKTLTLKQLMESLGLTQKETVTKEQFRKELEELTLREFLELTIQ